ncbi:hypothetical protein ATG66_0830 [Vibrio sp. ES.051]|uniref:hypothetical protein n=1 Tax=Vibrio sp. ES.051 TaxID=1761909 RepID=UPI000BF8D037|nr:hypothetical protein [Vibrio sp. ES.051]PFG58288.1 hypothetical protein ATG66_0830 [Vibrio sp. ES.051]
METVRLPHKKQHITALAIIFAVLFQLYLASTAVLNPTQLHSKNWLHTVQSEKVLLCTADGFKWVDINTLIKANAQSSSGFIQSLHLHEGFQFECPLLQAIQFFLLVVIGLYLATVLWLRRVKHTFNPYRFAKCDKLVYKHIAPKHSPPNVFPA